VTEIKDLPIKIVDAFIQIDDDFASVPPAQAIRVKSFNPITVEGKVVSPKTLEGSRECALFGVGRLGPF
jgi:hypothetical protein